MQLIVARNKNRFSFVGPGLFKRLISLLIAGLAMLWITACSGKEKADLLVVNAVIYTVDSNFSIAEAMVIRDGKLLATGTRDELSSKFEASEILDAGGRFIYPGFIDAHAHFVGYANSLQRVDLVGTKSWEEVVERAVKFAETKLPAADPGGWLLGRGWDQNDWAIKEFPSNEELNRLFPHRPVLLTRIDGHAAIANQKALEMAGIKEGDRIAGGEIETRRGKLTGVLIDNAVDLVSEKVPGPTKATFTGALADAERNCFAVGLTTVDDCGLSVQSVDWIKELHAAGLLKMRLYVMLSDQKENFDYAVKNGKIKTDRLNVRSFKVYADGALGSRGACLLQPYSDKPGWTGFLLSSREHFDSVAAVLSKMDFQMCTHAIGDSGNRTMLDIYARYLRGKNDLRWRIEHAQVVSPADFGLFGAHSVIPSVQPTHATSDMYWAADRVGPERVKGAYAYRQLMKENGWLALGTDFPVEDISPFRTFYAAVARKDLSGWPAGGFQKENALSREEALKGMTIWAARANFEEKEKGSLEPGKFADFVILDRDIMKAPEPELPATRVLKTYLNGEKVYESK